jgi:transcription initiation factor TFIIIB Brf1 subunit/transcription initiation factor TFIIB
LADAEALFVAELLPVAASVESTLAVALLVASTRAAEKQALLEIDTLLKVSKKSIRVRSKRVP